MADVADFFESRLAVDFLYMSVGNKIGYGISRLVYECKLNPDWVWKFETATNTFQNVMEWEIWMAVKDKPDVAKWLAPCQYISDNGVVLLQSRTRGISEDEVPKMVPSWICDSEPKNWGMLKGQPVIHDYGYTHLLENASKQMRMKKNLAVDYEKAN